MSRATFAAAALFLLVPAIHAQPKKEDENSKKVDEAIKKALKFLASTQADDGTWGAGFGARGRHPAITGLAVMAFLSAGNVPGEGPYGKTLEKAIRGVIKMQAANGLIASDAGHEMYHHGICTLMLAETAGMTQGPLAADVKKALEKAVAIVLQAQRKGTSPADPHKGGWRYRIAAYDSDISVTGWQIMALRAAKNVGCDVPPEAIDNAVAYVKRCQDPYSGAFRYTPGGGPTTPCTGTSILCLAVTGKGIKQLPEAIKGGNYLMRVPPRWGEGHFFYSIYYCSQACFQLGGNYWEFFRPKLHQILLQHQAANGSWPGDSHGPNYSTSMGILALTVEYRFLPIYQRGEEPTDKK